uniref:phospholipid scramblase 2-like n=1 Tax=Pristiophorus japonicus TaxID=55135 RepID=UPI00398F5709
MDKVRPANCPPGLEHILQIDQILIHQQIELLEVLFGFEGNNKYDIKNKIGQQIYFATERSGMCCRLFCGTRRRLKIKIVDNKGTEVIRLKRPKRCSTCWCPCCLQKLEVQAPPGEPIGYIVQKWHPCLPKFIIQDENQDSVLKINGPCCTSGCGCDVHFKIKNLDESETLGDITKKWGSLIVEAATDVDNFVINFPIDLDVRIKAALMGACFLITGFLLIGREACRAGLTSLIMGRFQNESGFELEVGFQHATNPDLIDHAACGDIVTCVRNVEKTRPGQDCSSNLLQWPVLRLGGNKTIFQGFIHIRACFSQGSSTL